MLGHMRVTNRKGPKCHLQLNKFSSIHTILIFTLCTMLWFLTAACLHITFRGPMNNSPLCISTLKKFQCTFYLVVYCGVLGPFYTRPLISCLGLNPSWQYSSSKSTQVTRHRGWRSPLPTTVHLSTFPGLPQSMIIKFILINICRASSGAGNSINIQFLISTPWKH